MADTKCKTCRRTGQKLFLKEGKCFGAKCTITRKHYAPGRRAKRPKPMSEYGTQLKEKQKLKFLYGLREKQFSNYVKKAMEKGGSNLGVHLLANLESRLDNTAFRLGFAQSRSAARQLVGHGHVCVNGRRVTIPSYHVKKGDKVTIREQSKKKKTFTDIDVWMKKFDSPEWLRLDKEKKEGEVIKEPGLESVPGDINLKSIIEFYSR